jgi:hypothetical protein
MSRIRRTALLSVLAALIALGTLTPSSFAQTPTLTGESLETLPGNGSLTFDEFTCDKDGTTTIPFTSSGLALGPYTGTFTETGTITIGPQTNTTISSLGVGPILAFDATFEITSNFPLGTVTGSKSLAPETPSEATLSAFGRCDPDGSTNPDNVFAIVSPPFIEYTAQIDSALGSRTDTGTGSVLLQTLPPTPDAPFFQQVFNSDQQEPPGECTDMHEGEGHENHGNGLGKGHLKHCVEQ